ncbi:signal recognition particle-docking protein FtsY [Martelella alba]|uniref:Signal recognition particle receptor FtsY n=1 Tax=Martelella alba TaxID=2590451 RepID=A0ABY2SNP2_9HYPH|nr:signal recognition particle-docking protein FtsY [Martelella alba]TKI07160.1 signal recognition particle-docking protein FtsY [Martelella alba]
MAKEKKRGFLSWLGINRQDDETQTPPEAPSKDAAEPTAAGDAAEPVAGDAAEPVAGDAAEPVAGDAAEPVAGDAAEPVAGDAAEPVAGDAAEPVAGDAAEPAAGDTVEPAAGDAAEPAAEAIVAVTEQAAQRQAAGTEGGEAMPTPPSVRDDTDPVTAGDVGFDSDHVAPLPSDTGQPQPPSPPRPGPAPAGEQPPVPAPDSEPIPPDNIASTAVRGGDAAAGEQERPARQGFFARLKRSLVKTRQNLGSGFIGLFRGKKIDDDLFEQLEEQLLIADVGVETTRKVIAGLVEHADRRQLKDADALYGKLKDQMAAILSRVSQPLRVDGKVPFVILMVGVNGVGKTTTIGKLARQFQAEGKTVMLAAGDTFRAAAVEQLQVWGERNHIAVVAQHTGADSASVIFDAIQAASARGVDVLIADTAGRLQNKGHLMDELKKIVRVMKKLDPEAPHEVMLTLDASTGQNAVSQAKLFNEAVALTGITLTKLDGTAKGGVIFAIADQFGIPIRYIGVGEGIEDLRPFDADDFIEALFARED